MGSAGLFTVPGLYAELLTKTPPMSEGPFYPNKMPLDTDNDLIKINKGVTPAVGAITHLHGKVTDVKGNPVRNAQVEIWQVDGNGWYLHTGDRANQKDGRDGNFQGFGRFLTDREGRYYFRTIKPVAYPGRTPHIHVAVYHKGKRVLTTQAFVKGDAGNKGDGLIKRLGDPAKHLMMEFKPVKDSKIGELSAEFNIVLGLTPADGHE